MNIGDKIRYLRRKENFTQADLAKKLNITTSAVGLWETSKREPDISYIVKIAQLFNVTTDFLLNNQNDNTIKVIGRSGTHKEFNLNDNQIKKISEIIEQLISGEETQN